MASFKDSLDDAIMFLESSQDLAPALATCAAALIDERSYSKPRIALAESSTMCGYIHELALSSRTLRNLVNIDPTFRRVRRDGKFVVTCFGMPQEAEPKKKDEHEYQVCISYASEDRAIAKRMVQKLKRRGSMIKVFFDEFEQHRLVGEPLTEMLYDVYANKSVLCIVLFSEAYSRKDWTRLEIRAARDRAMRSSDAYILPVAIDEKAVPAEFQSIGYWRLTSKNEHKLIDEIWARLEQWFQANWISIDDVVDVINRDRMATVLLEGFREGIKGAADDETADFLRLLGLVAMAMAQELSSDVRSFLDYLLFGYPAVAERFDEEDSVLVFGENCRVRRLLGRHGPIVLNRGWEDHITKFAEMYREEEGKLSDGELGGQED